MSNNTILELYGVSAKETSVKRWQTIVSRQRCPFLNRKCLKVRKSRPDVSIGTCSVCYGRERKYLLICPYRFLERRQVFTDCLQLLTLHQPGNELHLIPEVSIPGGNVDYFLASVNRGKVKDFVGVELQTLDSTGTIWPTRQRFLKGKGQKVPAREINSKKSFWVNWKMTAKTVLVQLHHKIETFEHLNKHLVLVIQDHLFTYMSKQFNLERLGSPCIGNPLQVHTYRLSEADHEHRLLLADRYSTDAEGLAVCLGLQVSPRVELQTIIAELERKLSRKTLFAIGA